MLRRKRGALIEETDILEHRPESSESVTQKEVGKIMESAKNKKGGKWVRFLDVAISCPSDESDDELAFCKPLWTKKTGQ